MRQLSIISEEGSRSSNDVPRKPLPAYKRLSISTYSRDLEDRPSIPLDNKLTSFKRKIVIQKRQS